MESVILNRLYTFRGLTTQIVEGVLSSSSSVHSEFLLYKISNPLLVFVGEKIISPSQFHVRLTD